MRLADINRRSPWLRYLILAVAGAIVLGVSGLALASAPARLGSHEKVVFEVTQGEGASSIANRLEEVGLVRDRLAFRTLSALLGWNGQLKVGKYEMSPGLSTWSILHRIGRGEVLKISVTIPEGYTLGQIETLLVEKGLATKASFDQAVSSADVAGEFPFLPAKRSRFIQPYEGILFPDTYFFEETATAETIVRTMARRTVAVFTPELLARAQELGLTPLEVLTLASIIEKEASRAEERPIVSSVYHNRLRVGIKLDACPTVRYVINKPPEKPLLFKDLEVISPYNTYNNAGLPPGPICSPGLAAIQAALYPAESDYYYFVAKNDGSHYFSRTLEEHNRAVAKYQGGN